MSIRIRLLLSYIAMLIIPIFVFALAVFIIGFAFIGDIKSATESYHLDFSNPESIKRVISEDENIFTELKVVSKYDPQKLQDPTFLHEMDGTLNAVKAGIIIRKNDTFIYVSPFLDPSVVKALPKIDSEEEQEHDDVKVNHHNYAYKQHDFSLNTKDKISIFVVKDVSQLERIARHFLPLIILALLLALTFTNGILTYFVSRSILRPLRVLKHATEQIKEGNLNFKVTPSSHDEIGELSVAFEKMREKLKESIDLQLQYEENRKELVSNISHDLKTPITTIKGYIEGIKDGVANTPEKLDKYLSTIHTKATDMNQLIDELFLFSKLDLKRLPFTFETIEMTRYVDDCIEEMRFDLEKQGISIERTKESDTPLYCIADRDKLKRVITNIIENSVKYMDKKAGHIALGITNGDEKVTIQLADNGPGIEAAALPFIFERFYRAEQSRNTSTGGSGLGLAIAKQIIQEHGGDIWAESEAGTGTRISFTLKKAPK